MANNCPITFGMIQALHPVYPDTGVMTLYKRTAGVFGASADTFDAGTECPSARKVEPNSDIVQALGGTAGEEWCEIHIWDRDQGVYPEEADVLEETEGNFAGTRWVVRKVSRAALEVIHVCTCQREVV